MPHVPAPAPFTDADYEMIAAAVLETARGRWFLTEHARRNRHADTRLVLEAIEKLERTIAHRPEMPESDRMRVDLVEMMNAIRRTKVEVAALQPEGSGSRFDQASVELDAIVEATEKATSDILAAAERVQEIAWTLREQGVDAAICDLIDAHATEVYTACSFQDLTGQRTRKVVEVMRFLEARIDAMVKIWRFGDMEATAEGSVPQAPQLRGETNDKDRLQQPAVDKLIGNERKPDVFWRDADVKTDGDAHQIGEFDLDDLVVYEAKVDPRLRTSQAEVESEKDVVVRDAPRTEFSPASAQPAPGTDTKIETAPPSQPSGKEEGGIESLTYTERLALFG